jgi:hypothetical protein
MKPGEIVSAYLEELDREGGEFDGTGGTLGAAECEEAAILSAEPEDDPKALAEWLEGMGK